MTELLRFVEHQTAFVQKTTAQVHTYHDFLNSEAGMILFNSTCMCLQSIGETIRQVLNDIEAGRREEEINEPKQQPKKGAPKI